MAVHWQLVPEQPNLDLVLAYLLLIILTTKKENKTSSYPEKNWDNVYISSTYNELGVKKITNQDILWT